MTHNNVRLSIFIIAGSIILLLISINSLLPSQKVIIAKYISGSSLDTIAFNTHSIFFNNNKQFNNLYWIATYEHEFVHMFKSMNMIDQDIPIAAAVGYYIEWYFYSTLRDKDKLPKFITARQTSNPTTEIIKIIDKYRNVDQETDESYSDGARLAGLVSKIFEKNDVASVRYLLGLAIGLRNCFALRFASNTKLCQLLLSFRYGKYLTMDEVRLNKDLNELDELSREVAISYLNRIKSTYAISLVPISTLTNKSKTINFSKPISMLFKNDADSIKNCIIEDMMRLISSHLFDHPNSIHLPLSEVLISFHYWEYFCVNEIKLNNDLSKLDKQSQVDAINYIKRLSNTYEIGITPKKEIYIESLDELVNINK